VPGGLSKANRTFRVAQRTDVLVVHLLAAVDRAAAELFGGETGDAVDKFARCRWEAGPGGAPVLLDAAGWFAGRVLERVDLGDHVGFQLEPLPGAGRAPVADGTGFLTFFAVRSVEPGHPA
jgi:flavin reductase (DIM6/NTAB) family NADH-FMN oxidoreductase RutF